MGTHKGGTHAPVNDHCSRCRVYRGQCGDRRKRAGGLYSERRPGRGDKRGTSVGAGSVLLGRLQLLLVCRGLEWTWLVLLWLPVELRLGLGRRLGLERLEPASLRLS